jgi:hypothetical protein
MAVYGAQTGKQNKISSSSTGKPVRESIISSSALSAIETNYYANIKCNQISFLKKDSIMKRNKINEEEQRKISYLNQIFLNEYLNYNY